jgi:hypothetical protein
VPAGVTVLAEPATAGVAHLARLLADQK